MKKSQKNLVDEILKEKLGVFFIALNFVLPRDAHEKHW